MPQPQLDRLLVVEDDSTQRDRLSQRLTRRGYLVDVASDGAGALEKIRQAEYDLILLDATLADQAMPGAGSLDLLRLLRATHSAADLPVIMLTDGDRNGTVVKALEGGANDYLVKPLDLPVMTARIEEQLSRSKIGRQRRSRRNKARTQRVHEGRWVWELGQNTIRFSARSRALLGLGREEDGHPSGAVGGAHSPGRRRARTRRNTGAAGWTNSRVPNRIPRSESPGPFCSGC